MFQPSSGFLGLSRHIAGGIISPSSSRARLFTRLPGLSKLVSKVLIAGLSPLL